MLTGICSHSIAQKIISPVAKSLSNSNPAANSYNSFIENIGQYGKTMATFEDMGEIKFGYEGLGMPVLFTKKGLIHLQRKVEKLSHHQEEKLEKQGLPEEEIERRANVTERTISMEWLGANTDAEIITSTKTTNYYTYGLLPGKAFGYKQITYKNIYPGIDIIYSFPKNSGVGFEYSLLLKPGADLSVVKMKYGGDVRKITKDKKGNLEIASDINGISVSAPISFYGSDYATDKADELKALFNINNSEISFLLPQNYDQSKPLIIDPFVTSTGNLTGANAGKAKDVDFDYMGNIYVTGGGDGITSHSLSKFTAAGALQWTFNGQLTIPSWNFGTYYGGWVVEKPTGNIYLAQGFNSVTGFKIIRINTTGLYDNYITTANANFREAWKMYWNCNNGSPQILVAGGGTNSNINFGTFTPPNVAIGSLNVTGIPYTGTAGWAQDIVDFVIDPSNNDVYSLYSSLIGNPSLNNKIYKNSFPYSGASVAWNTASGFVSVQEVANRPYLTGLQIDNSANIFALNSSYLFYWDGKNLKAFDKATGAGVGTALTIAANLKLMQGGIVADECNNVFIGSPNGTIKVYKFTGAIFDDAAAPDITITGFGTNSVYDLAYNEAQRILYASGNGFVASYDIAAYCPITVYTVNILPDCITASATATVSPAPPLGSNITFVLYDGTSVLETNTTGHFSGLSANINYKIVATVNLICSGAQTAASFVLPGPALTVANTNATCGNSTGTITATGAGGTAPYSYSIDGINFQPTGLFTALPGGIYSVVVKDAGGCITTKVVTIANSNGPTLSFTKTNATCGSNTGTVTATASGGTAPLRYSIDGVNFQSYNFFTGMLPAQYTLTVKDASGCTNAVLVTIISGLSPEITAIPATATCGSSNGKITAFGSSGTPPLEYSINGNIFQVSNIFNNLIPGNYTVTVRDATGCTKTTTVTLDNSPAPTVTATATAAACNNINGTITATGTGGVAPLQYSINGITFQASNLFNSLAAGTYTITVKDASGCTNSNTVDIGSTGGPIVSATSAAATCNLSNGSITIAVTGSGPFQYSYDGVSFFVSNVFNGIAAGTYIATAKDVFGCSVSVPIKVNNTAGPSLTVIATASSCNINDGTITATSVGGTAPKQYSIDGSSFQLSNIFSALAPNIYTVKIKDASGCINTAVVEVTNASGLKLSTSTINSSCTNNNGVITVIATGGLAPLQYSINGVAYQASNIFSALAGNTYTVFVKDANGCLLSTTATINVIAAPAISVISTDASCAGSNGVINITGSGGTGVLTYSINNVTFLSSGTFINLAPGTYTATVKDAVGCKATQSVTITNTGTGTGPTAFSLKIRNAYTCNGSLGRLSNFNVTGGSNPFEFSLNFGAFTSASQFTDLSPGVYTVTVKDANGCTKTISVTIADAVLSTASATVTGTACNTNNGTIQLTGIGPNTPYHASISGMAGPWATFDPTYTFTGLAAGTYTVILADDESFDIGPPIIPGGCLDTITVVVPSTGGPLLSTTKNNISCSINTGTITASSSGGVAPIQYSIDGINFQNSGDFIDLTAGIYEVTVVDGTGCSNSSFVTITEPSVPNITAETIATSCNLNNGSITASATGGILPLQYSIDGLNFQNSGNFANLADGTYDVYVKDASGCYGVITVTVLQTVFPSVIAATVSAACNKSDGAIIATGSNGSAPYQYSIDGSTFQSNNVFTGLAAGFYTVTIKDSRGCINKTSLTILNIAGPLLSLSSAAAKCGNANGTIIATGSGGTGPLEYSVNGTSFQVSNIFNGLLPGTYTILVKDANGCLNVKSVVVANINGPQELGSSNVNAACGFSNGNITVWAAGGTSPYQYSTDGIAYQTSSSFVNLAANNYTLFVKDANGCIKTLPVVLVNLAGPSISTTTSPASCNASDGTITTISNGGTGVLTYKINGLPFKTSNIFTGLATGTYTISVKDERGCSSTTAATVGVATVSATVTAVKTNATCGIANGTITATGVGGATPYQFSIDGIAFQSSNIFTGLATNIYTITIKDANTCTKTATAVITNTAGATVTAIKTNATCGNSNGTITATGAGGTKPYQFSIDGTNFQTATIFTGLAANTYTLTIKDANSCINTVAATITNINGATVTAVKTNATCGNANGSIIATGNGGTMPYQYSIDGSTFQASNIFNGLVANNYTVTIKDANNCTNTVAAVITTTIGATVTTVQTNTTCGNANGTITATGNGGTAPYQYSIDGITFQAANIFNGLAANNYTISIKDANNCINTFTAVISNTNGATVTAIKTNATCGNINGTITASGSGGSTPYQFSIDGSTFQASNMFTGLAANTYTVTIKDANNCTNTVAAVITNTAGATLTVIKTNATCGNANGTITVTGIGGTAPYQYSIDGTTFQASNMFNGLAANNYTVTIKDANDCINTDDAVIINTAGATITAMPTASTCGYANGTITATGNGGTTPYQFSIDNVTFQASNVFSGLAANNYTVTIKDANNCTSTIATTINNINGAIVTALSTESTCGYANGTITATGTGGITPYQFSVDGITFQPSAIFNGLPANYYTVTIKDANNCTYTVATTINNINGATVTAVKTNSTCSNADGTITATGFGGTPPYQFSIDNITFQASNVFSGLAANGYTITIKDANNCTNTFDLTINNTNGATVNAVKTNSTCNNADGTITATGNGGNTPYQFSIDGVTFQAGNVFTGLIANNYTVTIKDANNCLNTFDLTINNTNGATVTATPTASICGNNNGGILAVGSGGNTPYQFSIDGITFQTNNSFTGLAANNYTVTIKDANNCINTDVVTISNINGATVVATPNSSTCGNANGIITATESGGTAPYQFSIDGFTFQSSNVFSGLAANNYTVSIKDANNCISTDAITINNINGATVTATTTSSTCGNANGIITATESGGTAPYQFSIDGSTFQASNVFSGLAAKNYTITIKDANNCTNTDAITISNINGATVTATTNSSTCGTANGTIIANGSGGTAPYQFSIDGSTFQASNVFSGLAANNYTVTIKDDNNCTNTNAVTISNINGASVTATTNSATCGNANGIITATGSGGTTPYRYSIDGSTFQASTIFSGLAASNYTVTIKDDNNCTNTNAVTINNINGATVTATTNSSTCGNANGTITATGSGGTTPYQFSIDGSSFQVSNSFTGLAANNYTLTIKDANNCTNTNAVTISNINGAIVSATANSSICGNANGKIIATGSGGTTPYQFSIDGIIFQSSNSFIGLAANNYTVTIKDANNCTNTVAVTISNINGATVTATTNSSTCGNTNGTITATGIGGTTPYQFSIDGISFQTSNSFTGLAANNYTVTIKDANNCINIVTAAIVNINGATVTATTNSSTCGNANGIFIATGNGGTAPYQFSLDGNTFQTNNVFSGLSENTYIVTIKDANTCTSTATAVITNTAGATVTAIKTNSTCGNADGTITATGAGGTMPYLFSIDGNTFQALNVFSGLVADAYTVTIKDANSCTNTFAITINNSNGATVTVVKTNSTCSNADGIITATGTGGTIPYLFSIDGTTFQALNVFSGLAANAHTITIKDASNCINTATTVITNTAGATVTAVKTNATCGNADGTITATGIGGTAPYQFSMDGITFQASNVFNGLAANAYTITIKDANNCINTIAVTINNSNGAIVTAVKTNSTCSNAAGTITATGTGGAAPYLFSIDGSTFKASNTFSGLAANAYTVTIKDANNCINTVAVTINNLNGATVTAVKTNSTCSNADGTISATGIGGTTPYQFSIDGITFQTSNTFSGLAANAYTITIKDANNCINTFALTITNSNGAMVTATPTASTCGNSNGIVTATGTGGRNPYRYSIDGITFQASNIFNGLAANNYTVTIKDANNCTNTVAVTISNINGATLQATSTKTSCGNTDGTITAIGSGGTTPYQFSINGSTFQAANVFRGLAENTYSVTLKDANNCTSTTTTTITTNNNLTVNAGNDSSICEGKSVQLNASTNGTNISWSPANGLSSTSILNPVAHPTTTTKYYLTATTGNCVAKDSITIIVNAAPVANAGADAAICIGKSFQLSGTGGAVYKWSPPTYLSNSNIASPLLVVPIATTLTYYLTVTDLKGCLSLTNDSINIVIVPIPKVFAGRDTSIFAGQQLQLNAIDINNAGFVNYFWTPGYGLDNSFISNPLATLDRHITYIVKATTAEGCIATDDIKITTIFQPEILLPTAFSPNNDLINNTFKPILKGIKSLKHFNIYNRNGELVFTTSTQGVGWDGTYKGKPQNIGGYVWVLAAVAFDGTTFLQKGSVVLIR